MTSFDDFSYRSERIEELEQHNQINRWERLMFIAAVATALTMIEGRMPAMEYKHFFQKVNKNLGKFSPNGEGMLKHLMMFTHQRAQLSIPKNISIGSWVIINLQKTPPTDEELEVAPKIGNYLSDSLHDWWNH